VVIIELIRKMTSCVLIETSTNNKMMATTHAPMPKKKSMKPGTANSNKKKRKPNTNQMTCGFLKISILIL
jgi:hypothetical protein